MYSGQRKIPQGRAAQKPKNLPNPKICWKDDLGGSDEFTFS
jgi:hypothetical protein